MAKAYTSRLSNESFEAVESKLGGLGEESDKTSPNVEAFLCSDRKERKFTKEGFERFSASLMFPDSIPNTEVGFPTLELGKAKRMFGDVLSLVAGRPGAEVSLYHTVVRERYQIPFAGICEKAPIEFTGPIPVLVFRVINDFDGEKTGRFVALTGTQFEEGWDLEFLEGCRMAFKRLAEGTSVSLSTPVEGLGCDTRSFAMEFTSQDLEEPELINRCFEEFVPVFGEVSESVSVFVISIPKGEPDSGSLDDLKSELVRLFKEEHANKGYWTIQDVWMYSDDALRRRHLIAGSLFENEKMALTVWSGQVMGKRTELFRDYGRKGGRLGIRVWASGAEFEAVKAHAEGVLEIQFENKR